MKPENVLLSDHATKLIKICDFGLSKVFTHESGVEALSAGEMEIVMRSSVGSHHYASPELINGSASYDQSIDMWGLGLISYILLSGKHPFEDDDDMYGAIVNGRCAFDGPTWAEVSPACIALVRELLRPTPSERISAEGVLRHAWMTEGLEKDAPLRASLAYLSDFQAKEMRHATLKVLANSLTDEAVAEVRAIFDVMDLDQKGYLTHDDMAAALNHKARRHLGMCTGGMPRHIGRSTTSRSSPVPTFNPPITPIAIPQPPYAHRLAFCGRYNLPLLIRGLQRRSVSTTVVVTFEMFLSAVLYADPKPHPNPNHLRCSSPPCCMLTLSLTLTLTI